mmetsp:Transcript_60121/g.106932  ORF Transcript_60121/g.106932 Transcript_60121/m.106932 type:complete len:100 (-) Transcript_60121:7-306(-)
MGCCESICPSAQTWIDDKFEEYDEDEDGSITVGEAKSLVMEVHAEHVGGERKAFNQEFAKLLSGRNDESNISHEELSKLYWRAVYFEESNDPLQNLDLT